MSSLFAFNQGIGDDFNYIQPFPNETPPLIDDDFGGGGNGIGGGPIFQEPDDRPPIDPVRPVEPGATFSGADTNENLNAFGVFGINDLIGIALLGGVIFLILDK